MKVRYGQAEHAFDAELTVRHLLEKLDVVPEGVVVAVNGELVTSDTMVRVGDDVEIIRAVSGGGVGREHADP